MTLLLVSVRSAAEAQVALAGGADIIDVKEPARGALGAADVQVWHAVRDAVAGRLTTSVALGELASGLIGALAPQTGGFAFGKIGFALCAEIDWRERWRDAVQQFASGVCAVPVAYADWRNAGAPPPRELLGLAAESSKFLVLDTYEKSSGSLLDYVPAAALGDFLGQAASLGVKVTLAGSLTAQMLADVLPLGPAYVGVRGAACRGGRQGIVDLERVRALASFLNGENVRFSTSGD
jgi:uncharacterized protein (UPF0264 family)